MSLCGSLSYQQFIIVSRIGTVLFVRTGNVNNIKILAAPHNDQICFCNNQVEAECHISVYTLHQCFLLMDDD